MDIPRASGACPPTVSRAQSRAVRTANSLDLNHTPVHEQLDTSNETRVIRNKKNHRLGNLVRLSHSAQWDLGCKTGLQLLRLFRIPNKSLDCGCIDRSRADDVHSDLAILELVGPSPGE